MESAKEIKYLILVVVYNMPLNKAETIISLVNSNYYLYNACVIIWDNSAGAQQASNTNWLSEQIANVEYIHEPDNMPLSRIYNNIITKYRNHDFDYLVLFDQDSGFSSDYFWKLNESIIKFRNISLFLPTVISSNNIVSPADLFMFKGRYWKIKKIGLVKAKHKSAINSGMVISFKFIRNQFTGYDERFKFYGTDTYFMKMYARGNDYFCVFDSEILHHLAYCDFNNVDGIIQRHPENMRAILMLNDYNVLIRLLTKFYIILFSIKQSVKYKSIRFFKW